MQLKMVMPAFEWQAHTLVGVLVGAFEGACVGAFFGAGVATLWRPSSTANFGGGGDRFFGGGGRFAAAAATLTPATRCAAPAGCCCKRCRALLPLPCACRIQSMTVRKSCSR